MTSAQDFAAQLAASSLALPTHRSSVCNRSLAPSRAAFAVPLPPCWNSSCGSRRASALIESDQPGFFIGIITLACWLAMTDEERAALRASSLKTARRAIDTVSNDAVRIVDPGFEDVARIASADRRADVMLALGWLTPTCVCMRALTNSLPDDTPQGAYVRAGLTPRTARQRAEVARDKVRKAERSASWSAYLAAKAEERRRPAIGDLFADFDFDAWDRSTVDPTSLPAR